jgi:hypothetical protein
VLRRDDAAMKFDELVSNWTAHCQPIYGDLPDALRRKFIADPLGYIVTPATITLRSGKAQGEAKGADPRDV